MTDNELIKTVRALLKGYLDSAFGVGRVEVVQKQNPTQQGVRTEPTVYLEKLFDRRVGFAKLKETFNKDKKVFDEEEEQWYETSIQISTLVLQKPDDLTIPTASDLLNQCAGYLQSRNFSRTMEKRHKANVLRSSDLGNAYFTDDRDRQEAHPVFTLVVTHKRKYSNEQPAIEATDVEIHPI